jgi:hypothetical protein
MNDELTLDILHEAIDKLGELKEIPIRYELSPRVGKYVRDKIAIYSAPPPQSILSHCMGLPVVESPYIPDDIAIMVYQDCEGKERREVILLAP